MLPIEGEMFIDLHLDGVNLTLIFYAPEGFVHKQIKV